MYEVPVGVMNCEGITEVVVGGWKLVDGTYLLITPAPSQ